MTVPASRATCPRSKAFVEQFDICRGSPLLNAEGTAPVSAAEFQIDKKLGSARVTKTVTLTDESGNSLDVSVDLTWTATSQPEVTRNRFYSRTPGRITHEQNKGTFREASAAGTVASGAHRISTKCNGHVRRPAICDRRIQGHHQILARQSREAVSIRKSLAQAPRPARQRGAREQKLWSRNSKLPVWDERTKSRESLDIKV